MVLKIISYKNLSSKLKAQTYFLYSNGAMSQKKQNIWKHNNTIIQDRQNKTVYLETALWNYIYYFRRFYYFVFKYTIFLFSCLYTVSKFLFLNNARLILNANKLTTKSLFLRSKFGYGERLRDLVIEWDPVSERRESSDPLRVRLECEDPDRE